MYARIASDEAWLEEVLGEEGGVLEEDELGSLLWGVHLRAREVRRQREGDERRLELGIWRSDYMVSGARDDEDQSGGEDSDSGNVPLQLKQVEFNTMACAGARHGDRVAKMHRHFARTGAYDPPLDSRDGTQRRDNDTAGAIPPSAYTATNMPCPNTASSLVSALAAAHTAYNDLFYPLHSALDGLPRPATCILILSQPHNINPSDELPLLTALWSSTPFKASAPTYTAIFPSSTLLTSTHLDITTGILTYTPPFSPQSFEVSVLYWRSGHELHEYTGVDVLGIEIRTRLEASRAVLCPSVLGQLAGSKAVQGALSSMTLEQLARFLPGRQERVVAELAGMGVGCVGLGSPAGRALMAELVKGGSGEEAEDWFLKPACAEGGGHNISSAVEVVKALQRLQQDDDGDGDIGSGEAGRYVLMRRIRPPRGLLGVLVLAPAVGPGRREGAPATVYAGEVVPELGIWGTCLFRRRHGGVGEEEEREVEILRNEVAGFSVRTKRAGQDEMSVVKGYGAFDSLVLLDEDVFRRACRAEHEVEDDDVEA